MRAVSIESSTSADNPPTEPGCLTPPTTPEIVIESTLSLKIRSHFVFVQPLLNWVSLATAVCTWCVYSLSWLQLVSHGEDARKIRFSLPSMDPSISADLQCSSRNTRKTRRQISMNDSQECGISRVSPISGIGHMEELFASGWCCFHIFIFFTIIQEDIPWKGWKHPTNGTENQEIHHPCLVLRYLPRNMRRICPALLQKNTQK